MADNHNVNVLGNVQIAGANGKALNLIPESAFVVTPHASATFPAGLLRNLL